MIVNCFEFLLFAIIVISGLYILSLLNLTAILANMYFLKPPFVEKEIELPKVKNYYQ